MLGVVMTPTIHHRPHTRKATDLIAALPPCTTSSISIDQLVDLPVATVGAWREPGPRARFNSIQILDCVDLRSRASGEEQITSK